MSPVRYRGQRLAQVEAAVVAARTELRDRPNDLVATIKPAVRCIARCRLRLSEEIAGLDEQLDQLVADAAPTLGALRGMGRGMGIDTRASLLITVGDNPGGSRARRRSLTCRGGARSGFLGQSETPPSQPQRQRDPNRALYLIALERISWHERTRTYVARLTVEGKSKSEGARCLKRFIVREVYRGLIGPPLPLPSLREPALVAGSQAVAVEDVLDGRGARRGALKL